MDDGERRFGEARFPAGGGAAAGGGPQAGFPAMIWARVTAGSGSGPYAFHQLIPEAGGTWSEGPINDQGGKDPAWSYNPTELCLPWNVELYRVAGLDGESWRFQAG